MDELTTSRTKSDEIYDLGTWMGRKQAFSALAGRCSAADAECLRQVKNRKGYRALKLGWGEFCKQRMGISRGTAEKIIRRLEEFGPQYFILAQATGIKPDEYRRISGAVRGQMLLHAGEEIAIDAENAPRLTAAIEGLRRGGDVNQGAGTADAASAAEVKMEAEIEREFQRAAGATKAALHHFQRLVQRRTEGRVRMRLIGELGLVARQISELEQAAWQ